MRIFKLLNNKKRFHGFVEPDEIFLDSKNLPQFDTQQFEGRIETPIKKRTMIVLGVMFVSIIFGYSLKLRALQLRDGEIYKSASENNSLGHDPLFAPRGVIYDRNGVVLASNEPHEDSLPFSRRHYIDIPGFSHLLGYVSYPTQDKDGFFWRSEYLGRDGIEKTYHDVLEGVHGTRITERDALGKEISTNIVEPPIPGKNITLTIDSDIQAKIYEKIKELAGTAGYQGGSGVLMDVTNGEVIALTSYPEYDNNLVSKGDNDAFRSYTSDSRRPFLNRAISGLYTPGSIVKPYIAVGALDVGVVTPETSILSRGSISIPNPFVKGSETVFRDYRADNGWVNVRRALAVSSNIYFYQVSGGYKTQKGIGIAGIQKYIGMFGIGQKTDIDLPGEVSGVVPSIEWKEKNFPGDIWRIGDTYNTAIGQYGFQVTAVQMVRAVSAIANGGKLVFPRLVNSGDVREPIALPVDGETIKIVGEGMRMVVTDPNGTAKGLEGVGVEVSAKTGTAEVGRNNEFVNSWVTLFFPSSAPKYALAVVMERAPGTPQSAQFVARELLSWLSVTKPEYIQ